MEEAAREAEIRLPEDDAERRQHGSSCGRPAPTLELSRNPKLWRPDREAKHIIEEYLSRGEGRYYALFSLSRSLPMSAINHKYAIAPDELAGILADLQDRNPPTTRHTDRNLREIAESGIEQAKINIGDDPAFKRQEAWKAYLNEITDDDGAHDGTEDEKADGKADAGGKDDAAEARRLARRRALRQARKRWRPGPAPEPNRTIAGACDYNFEDCDFGGKNGIRMPIPDLLFLANRCVRVGRKLFLRDPTGYWREIDPGKLSVVTNLKQLYAGYEIPFCGVQFPIDADVIEEFRTTALTAVDGFGFFPEMGPLVQWGGRKYVNDWHDARLVGRERDLPAAEPILRMISESLCNRPTAERVPDLFDPYGEDEYGWVVQWLADLYQRPGGYGRTALWFIDVMQGAGKGTLATILREIVGHTGALDDDEIRRGWTNAIEDKLLVIGDEFRGESRKAAEEFFKRVIGAPVLRMTARHRGIAEKPNYARFLLTTNNLRPIKIPATDRRHTFIATTDDPEKKKLAVAVNRLKPEQRRRALSGFAYFLSLVQVDQEFIGISFHNELRETLIEASTSPIEAWFQHVDAEWSPGEVWSNDKILGSIRDWGVVVDDIWAKTRRSPDQLGCDMRRLTAQAFVQRVRTTQIRGYHKIKRWSADVDNDPVVASLDKIKAQGTRDQ